MLGFRTPAEVFANIFLLIIPEITSA